MTNQVIPEAAVEAAAMVLCEQLWDNAHESQRSYAREEAREALEAAAPHMLAPLLSLLDEAENRRGSSMYCKVTTREARKAIGQDVSDWKPSEPWPSGLRDRLAAWAKEPGGTTR